VVWKKWPGSFERDMFVCLFVVLLMEGNKAPAKVELFELDSSTPLDPDPANHHASSLASLDPFLPHEFCCTVSKSIRKTRPKLQV
jgi:hypothetical protein